MGQYYKGRKIGTEDNKSPAEFHSLGYNRGFDIPAGKLEDVGHDRLCFHNTHNNGGYGINIFVPCPHSKEFADAGIKTSTGGAGEQFLTVLFEGIRDGKIKTIFACARCGQEQRFRDDGIVKIKDRAREYFAVYDRTGKGELYGGNQGLFDNAMKVIERIK